MSMFMPPKLRYPLVESWLKANSSFDPSVVCVSMEAGELGKWNRILSGESDPTCDIRMFAEVLRTKHAIEARIGKRVDFLDFCTPVV